MRTLCQQIQVKLLDLSAEGLSPEESAHAEHCVACGEAVENMPLSAYLALSGCRAAARTEAMLPAELKSRVRSELVRAKTRQAAAYAEPAKPAFGLRDLLAWLRDCFAPPRMRLVLVAAAAVAAVGLGLLAGLEPKSIGALEYADGTVTIRGGSAAQEHQGLGAWEYAKSARLETDRNSSAQFRLGEDILGALAASTVLEMRGEREVVLVRGGVWFDVEPRGKGFLVRSPNGLVRVTGTQFGVRVAGDGTLVEVARGKVEVRHADKKEEVSKRQMLSTTATSMGPVRGRPNRDSLPTWVDALVKKRDAARDQAEGEVLPSVKLRNKP